MINKPIPYGHQHINDEDVQAVVAALKSDYMTQGPLIGQFEKNFAEYLGVKYACVVSNGTAATSSPATRLLPPPLPLWLLPTVSDIRVQRWCSATLMPRPS